MGTQQKEKEQFIPVTFATFVTEQTGRRQDAKANKDDIPTLQELYIEYVNFHLKGECKTFKEAEILQKSKRNEWYYKKNREAILESNARSKARKRIMENNPNMSEEELAKEIRRQAAFIISKRKAKEKRLEQNIKDSFINSGHPGFNESMYAKVSKKKLKEIRQKEEEDNKKKTSIKLVSVETPEGKVTGNDIISVTSNSGGASIIETTDTKNLPTLAPEEKDLMNRYRTLEQVGGFKGIRETDLKDSYEGLIFKWFRLWIEPKDLEGTILTFPQFYDKFKYIADDWGLMFPEIKFMCCLYDLYMDIWKDYHIKL